MPKPQTGSDILFILFYQYVMSKILTESAGITWQ